MLEQISILGSKSVLITFTYGNTIIYQSGILIGENVITTAGAQFRENLCVENKVVPVDILLTIKGKDSVLIKKSGSLELIWTSSAINKTLDGNFLRHSSHDISMKDLMHYIFLLIKVDKGPEMVNECTLVSQSDTLKIGQEVTIVNTPFGIESLLNCISKGIISNFLGNRKMLFLTDTRLAPCCSGSPVYVFFYGIEILVGMVLTTFSNLNGERSGFSIAANITSIINSLTNSTDFKFRETILEHPLQIDDRFVRRNFIVKITYKGSLGSGIIVDSSGLILTCAHVILYEEGVNVDVILDNEECYTGVVVKTTSNTDLLDVAFISVNAGKILPNCHFSRTHPKNGDEVYAVGYSLFQNEFLPHLSKGNVTKCNGISPLVTNCLVHSGLSGGAILNKDGQVIGIVTHSVTDGSELYAFVNISIPITALRMPIQTYMATKDSKSLLSFFNNDVYLKNGWYIVSKL